MLVGDRVIARTAREGDLGGLHDLIAVVRTIGDRWLLSVRSEFNWLKQFRDNGWWTEDFRRKLVTERAQRIL